MTSAAAKFTGKRAYTRFKPDPNATARVAFASEPGHDAADLVGLVADESYAGCSVVMISHPRLVAGARCRIAVGRLDPTEGEVVWVREIDAGVSRVGFRLAVDALAKK